MCSCTTDCRFSSKVSNQKFKHTVCLITHTCVHSVALNSAPDCRIIGQSNSLLPDSRVRTILVLGYWVLGNIHRYWVVLLLGDIFCRSDTQYNTNQTAVSTVHMPVNSYLVPLVTCTLTDAIVCLDTMLICCYLLNTIIVIIIEFWDFSWSLLCHTLVIVSVLVLGIGIARGQYYWVLYIRCLAWYRSNPTRQSNITS